MKKGLTAMAALLMSGMAHTQTVEIGEGSWSNFPLLRKNANVHLLRESMTEIDRLMEAGKCPGIGNKKRIRLRAPFIVKVSPTQEIERIVIGRVSCEEVQQIVASTVLTYAKTGMFKSADLTKGWYRGEARYSLD